jgi:PEP-CTERM motif
MKRLIFVAAFCLAAVAPVHADVITAYFTIKDLHPSVSGGTIVFALNPDGTISASLHSVSGDIGGFGFDSIVPNLPESNFSPTVPFNTFGWATGYGYHASGFFCLPQCGPDESWTIGNPGDFTSVLQALGGGTASYDFLLLNSAGDWAADLRVPEPATLALLGIGLAGLGFSRRRKL